ncbi:MAG: starch-binding protein [Ruminococcaceae bacterium]|nr:starch-binding protein [Oscillospiraceae bacterium]
MKFSTRLIAILLCVLMVLSVGIIGIVSITSANAATTAITYSFENDKQGFAQGTITLTPDNSDFGTYYLYWADDTAALKDYSEIATLTVNSGSGTVTMPPYTTIPADATKLIAIKSSTEPAAENRTVSNAASVYTIPESKLLPFDTKDALYTFGAISDPQLANDSYGSGSYPYDEDHLTAALRTLYDRNVDFTVSSGDTVNDQNGKQTYAAEYRTYQRILADSYYCKPIYEANGNHDVGTVWNKNGNYYNDNTPFIMGTGLDSKAETINKGLPYFEVTEPTTGDHFIFMALEGGFYTNKGTQFSKAQLDWLEGLLKNYSGDGKNIFIIEHANITGWGSGDKLTTPYYYDLALEKSNADVTRFVKLMETYKECVIITGHTHLELSAQYNYSDNNGTSAVMMHNSAIGGVRRLINGKVDRTAVLGMSEGYIVEVYEDAILFNGTNMYYNETMPQCCYIVKKGDSDTQVSTNEITTKTDTDNPDNPAEMTTVTLKSSGSDTDWVLNSTDRYVLVVDTDTNKEYVATLTSDGWAAEIPASVKNITFHRVKNGVISHTWLAGNRNTDINYYITGDARGNWENEVVPDYADVYLPGAFNSWDQSDAFIKTDDANIVTRTFELSAGTYEFKIIEGSTWLGNNGTITDTTTTSSSGGWEMTAGTGNCKLVAAGGTYTFNFNTSTNKLIVLHTANTKSISAIGADVQYKYGDADLNGTVNIKDATAIQKHAASLITLEGIALIQAEVTADGIVNVKDATAIQKFVAGLLEKFPADSGAVAPSSTEKNTEEPSSEPTTVSSEEPSTPSTNPISPDPDVFEKVKETLEKYYIYSSYDQYMALKNEYSYSTSAENLANLQAQLITLVNAIGGEVAPEELGEINIYFLSNKNWSKVYAYVWGSAGNGPAWPGTEMTKVTENSQNESIYKITVDLRNYQNIIFTNDSGEQTEDVVIVGKDNKGYRITGGPSNKYTCEPYDLFIG